MTKTKYTQLVISTNETDWVIAGESKSNDSKGLRDLKVLEWDLRNKNRNNPQFKMKYREVVDQI